MTGHLRMPRPDSWKRCPKKKSRELIVGAHAHSLTHSLALSLSLLVSFLCRSPFLSDSGSGDVRSCSQEAPLLQLRSLGLSEAALAEGLVQQARGPLQHLSVRCLVRGFYCKLRGIFAKEALSGFRGAGAMASC